MLLLSILYWLMHQLLGLCAMPVRRDPSKDVLRHENAVLIDAARLCRHVPGDRWFVDETYVKVAGRWVYLYRAIDQYDRSSTS